MGDKFNGGIGLGLNLSLSLGHQNQHNLSPFSSLNDPLGDLFNSSSGKDSDSTAPFQRDMNQSPDSDEQGGASSPNSTISSASAGGKRELQEVRASCSLGGSDDEDAAADGSRKKLRLTKEQSVILEETFKQHNTLNPKEKVALAKQLNLRPRQVEVWFQNRRARTKLKQTEVDCEYLKRCCENLTQENRRLQKEVQELRALKLSPQLYTQMTPPTTLTMCPSCERVAAQNRQPTSSYLQRPVAVKAWLPVSLNRS